MFKDSPRASTVGGSELEITQALVGKGGAVAPEAEADAQVVIHGASKTKHSLNTFYSGMGGYGWRGWGAGGFGTATTTASELNGTKLTKVVHDNLPSGLTVALELTVKGDGTIKD